MFIVERRESTLTRRFYYISTILFLIFGAFGLLLTMHVQVPPYAPAKRLLQSHHSDYRADTAVARTGHVLNWTGTGIAVVLVALGLLILFASGDEFLSFALWVCAALVWLLGRAFRYIMAGPRSTLGARGS
jgi:hypothetical protein